MSVHVRYFNVLAEYAGTRRAEVQVEEHITVQGLIQHLIEHNPESFRRWAATGSSFNPHLRVFHNARLVGGNDFETPVADGDEFLLFPAIAGG